MTQEHQTGRANDYTKCWNCDGYVGKNITKRDDFENECPLCFASPLVIDE